ncbi:TPA_asm: N [Passiflora betacytorhabdovirus 1]|nr:TPA_asm: N [Passiflora betacytorhabdovirus 1]
MATITNEAIRNKFAALHHVSLQTSEVKAIEYSDTAVINKFQYYNMTPKTKAQLKVIYGRLDGNFRNNTVTTRTALDLLEMAVHLQNPQENADGSPKFVYTTVFPTTANRQKNNFGDYVPDIDFPEYTAAGTTQVVATTVQQPQAQTTPATNAAGSTVYDNMMPPPINSGQSSGTQATPPPPPPINNANTGQYDTVSDQQLKEMSFISAFLLRLVSKAVINVERAWTNTMTARFLKWYGSEVSRQNPGSQFLTLIKNLLDENKTLRVTWIMTVSMLDDVADQDSTESGLNRYLGVTPLSYGAMQAQNLFMQAWHKTKISPQYILQEGYCPGTARAIECIAKLIIQYEPKALGTEVPSTEANIQNGTAQLTSKKRFRYARLISPGYFVELQSKEANQALYLFACLLSKVQTFNDTQNPNNIVAVADLGADIKAYLKRLADYIFDQQVSANENLYSATALRAMSGPAPGENHAGVAGAAAGGARATGGTESIPLIGANLFDGI